MEKIFEYIFVHLKIEHDTAPIVAFILAIIDNKARGLKDCIIVSFMAVGVAGTIESYLPAHTVFTALLVGILSGISTDDLYTKFITRFPTFLDDILDIIMIGIKNFIKRIFGEKD